MSNHIKSITFTRDSMYRGQVIIDGGVGRIDEDDALILAAPFLPSGWLLDSGADQVDGGWVVLAYRDENK